MIKEKPAKSLQFSINEGASEETIMYYHLKVYEMPPGGEEGFIFIIISDFLLENEILDDIPNELILKDQSSKSLEAIQFRNVRRKRKEIKVLVG